jgi:hypothetical protein
MSQGVPEVLKFTLSAMHEAPRTSRSLAVSSHRALKKSLRSLRGRIKFPGSLRSLNSQVSPEFPEVPKFPEGFISSLEFPAFPMFPGVSRIPC